MAFKGAGGNNAPDIPETMVRLLHPTQGGVTYTGFFSEGSSFQKGDPEITALLEKTRAEFDTQKRIDIVNQVQRLHAERQYVIRTPGGDELQVNSMAGDPERGRVPSTSCASLISGSTRLSRPSSHNLNYERRQNRC